MPFQPINFAGLKPQGDPRFQGIAEAIQEGYKTAHLPSQLAADTAKKNAEAQKAQQLANLFKSVFGGQDVSQAQGYEDQNLNNGNEMLQSSLMDDNEQPQMSAADPYGQSQMSPSNQMQQNRPISNGQQPNYQNYQRMALAQGLLGLGKPEILDLDGRKVAISPFGSTEIGRGLSEREKEFTKQDVKASGDLLDQIMTAQQQEPVLENIKNILQSPEFANMREYAHLAPQTEMAYYRRAGSPIEQELAGEFINSTNQYIAASAKLFGSRTTDADLRFLQSMKISDKDTLHTAMGKAKAAQIFSKLMSDRNLYAYNLTRQGANPAQALNEASKIYKLDDIKKAVKSEWTKSPQGFQTTFKDQEDFAKYMQSLSPKERQQWYEQYRKNK